MNILPRIVFEDKYLLVLEKPTGWIVNQSFTTRNQKNILQSWLNENFTYESLKIKELRSGIVHRLDKETSGILVVAKTKEAFLNLQSQFKKRSVKKIYVALVHNILEPEQGEVNVPLGRLPWNRERFGVLLGGRESKTKFKVIAYYSRDSEKFSLVEFYPQTGRTHQIRVHAKYINHPVVSDSFYAGRKTSKKDRMFCPRLFLHAKKIELLHPQTKKRVTFESKLPKDLDEVLSRLKKEKDA